MGEIDDQEYVKNVMATAEDCLKRSMDMADDIFDRVRGKLLGKLERKDS